MLRILLIFCFMAGAFSSGSQAQAFEKSYAPENLRQLSYNERVRVIEKEYYEQSNGRDIRDDQLEFYLDSIDSGWTFSRVRDDIAVSLSGNNNGSWNPGGNWSARNVICSSVKNNYTECRTPFRGRAVVTEQISKTRCQEGQNWGQRQDVIWVNRGCRARFSEISGGGSWDNGNNWANNNRVLCESPKNRYNECRTNFRGPAQIHRKLSKNACDINRDWGSRAGLIWVNNGCRAEFYDSHNNNSGNWDNGNDWNNAGNSNYSVTCSSDGSNYRTCAWDHRYGSPQLLQQLSKKTCISGRNWGYDNRGLWVSDGCRARFGLR